MSALTSAIVSYASINTIDSTVESIIEFSKKLWEDKQNLGKKEWRQHLNLLGWTSTVVAKYIKIGKAFETFDTSKLTQIEPSTLFKITSSKRFASVVEGIKSTIGHITQQFVEHLIESNKKAPVPSQETPTVWRGEGASRRCVVPPIKEDDQFTGMLIQRAMDREGISAQKAVRQAFALREALEYGAITVNAQQLPEHLRTVLGEFMHIPSMDDSEEISVYEYEVYPEYDTVEVDLEPNRRQPCTTKTITQTTTVTTPPIYVEAPLPHEHNTNDFLIKETRAELLACTTWQEVEAIIGNLTEDAKGTVWATFTTEQKRAFKGMKIRFVHCGRTSRQHILRCQQQFGKELIV